LENPSFLAINTAATHLYSVHGDRSEANSFSIDRRSGHIAPLNRQSTGGYNPVHLAFDATERFLAICNYGSDSLAVLPVAADGSLMPYRTLATVTGTLGPHRFQQRTMCVHHIPLDRQGRFFYVPCKGSDVVIAYRLDTRRRMLVDLRSATPIVPGLRRSRNRSRLSCRVRRRLVPGPYPDQALACTSNLRARTDPRARPGGSRQSSIGFVAEFRVRSGAGAGGMVKKP
jgi:hypothetical protein